MPDSLVVLVAKFQVLLADCSSVTQVVELVKYDMLRPRSTVSAMLLLLSTATNNSELLPAVPLVASSIAAWAPLAARVAAARASARNCSFMS